MNHLLAHGWEAIGLLLTGSMVVVGAIWGLSAAGTRVQPGAQEPDGDNRHRRPRDADKKGLRPAPLPNADADEEFAFQGRHLIASYTGCSLSAMRDVDGLTDALHAAVAASGATLLQSVRHIFPPDGMTALVLLSESHASIHTYPEHRSCFVDIFTCGSSCQ